jgi:hypothetical protein
MREAEEVWGTTRALSEHYLLMRPFDPPFEKSRVPSVINL